MDKLTFNDITYDAFMDAVQTAVSYLNSVSALPINKENEPAYLMTAIAFLPLTAANRRFMDAIQKLHDTMKKESCDSENAEKSEE